MASHKHNFEPGKKYRVKHGNINKKEGGNTVVRIFKWTEHRFGDIPCYVFTSKVNASVSATYDPSAETLTISGRKLPASEVSIPEYCLIEVEAVLEGGV